MTGIELLRKKMMELGASKQQTESKVVDYVLAAFAEEQGSLDAVSIFEEMREQYLEKHKEMTRAIAEADKKKDIYERSLKQADKIIGRADREFEEAKALNEKILEMETPEMRDRYRMAVRYEKMAYADNAYARTEYTKGLALIMAGMNTEKGEWNE